MLLTLGYFFSWNATFGFWLHPKRVIPSPSKHEEFVFVSLPVLMARLSMACGTYYRRRHERRTDRIGRVSKQNILGFDVVTQTVSRMSVLFILFELPVIPIDSYAKGLGGIIHAARGITLDLRVTTSKEVNKNDCSS